jgi:hypothetical protein
VIEVRMVNEGRCLRCAEDVTHSHQLVVCMVHPGEYVWALCLPCWNEIVAMDTRMREQTAIALYPDGSSDVVRTW